ncbi:MAG: acyl-CoA dehydrogenase family protein [Actinomycetota bacterium]|nr:acyl-CoA dehydrogenase family protein [Actinomycetota bacterium]MDD5667991.1 acyl-CoA dehydrogenase family protein [Actinomycetota bacterium]
MDFALSDEQKALKQTVHEFAENEIRPISMEMDEKGEFAWDVVRKAARLELTYSGVPEEYGGPGLSMLDNVIVIEELGWGCVGIASAIALNQIAILPVLLAGTEEQKKRYLPRITDSDNPRLCAFGLTEPEAGSDAASLKTRAVRDGDDYVLTGGKCFITNGGISDFYTIFTTVDPDQKYQGITAFIVEADTPGFSIGKIEHKMGMRASQTAELILEDVRVPASNILRGEGQGFYVAMETLDSSRPGVGAIGVGLARAAFEEALAYSRQRVQFGKPICRQQAIAFMLADMATKVDYARLLCYRAAWMLDNGLDAIKESSMAKYTGTDVAMEVVTDAVQIHGGYGYMKEYLVEKFFRDAKILQIVEGTNQIQRLVLSAQLIN